MILRYLLAVLLLGGAVARAQTRLVVRLDDAGPGRGPEMLSAALARPYTVIPPASGEAALRRDTTYGETVVILARDAVVDGTVTGDVIVIGGDLHVHPRADIRGRAIAIGGGVYESSLSHVGGGISPFRDFTYDFAEIPGGYALRYRSLVDRPNAAIDWRGFYGFGIPAYDRSNGLSVAVGPLIAVPATEILVEPRVTYRSNLGRVDPSVAITYPFDSRTTLRANVGRSTFTNENWIWPDLMNSASALLTGHDTRNYFRATRAEARLARLWEGATMQLEPYVGARWERARSVGPSLGATGGPWSFRGRRSTDDMLRPNPRIDDGTIGSGIVGARLEWSNEAVVARANVDAEVGTLNPVPSAFDTDTRTFGQLTFDGTITFPTFGAQTLRFDAHAVGSTGDLVPRQRWAYLGGSGSVPTLDMLERGGDQLIYLDGRYNIPIERVMLPFVGSPVLTLREVLAGADLGRWPGIAQSTGVRVAVSLAYVEFMIDPVSRHTHFGVGLSFAR